jgi:hypothetical protein
VATSAIAAPLGQALGDSLLGTQYNSQGKVSGHEDTGFTRFLSPMGAQFTQAVADVLVGTVRQGIRMAVYGKGKLDFASIAADAFGSALGNGLVNQINDRHSSDLWQRQLGEHLDEQRYEQRDFEDSLNDQAHAGYLAERQRDIADRLNDAAHAGYLASRQRDIADRLNDRTHAGYLAGVRAKAAEQRAAQAARLGQAIDRNSHRAAELSQQAQATRVENQMRITSGRLPDYGVMHPRLKGATLPVGQVSERFNAFRKELEARSAVDPNNLVHLYERIVSEQKNIGSRTDLLTPTESLRLTSMEAYVRGYANLKGIQLPSEAEFYGGMQALGTPVGDAGAPPYGARRITPASLRNNGGVTNGVVGANKTLTTTDFPEVAVQVSQKQFRHIAGRPEHAARGGGYLNSIDDAQAVLDAYRSGSATILGRHPQGFPVIRVEGITGTNVNIGAGITNQPTNVFMIKGTASPSVVPINPNWKPK